MIVECPTSTHATSVIALSAPGIPSNGIPKSRARGLRATRFDLIAMGQHIAENLQKRQEILPIVADHATFELVY
jgi:hypothetical protein